ncbi:MAG: NUDIX domain-containing protein [Candidatus Buchananbacteria bacterium]
MKKHHQPETFMVSLKVLLNDKNGQTLLLKSPVSSKCFRGKYDLPGGRINDNETHSDFHLLIDREIKEEVGNIKYELRADPVSLAQYRFSCFQNRCCFYVLFEAKYLSGKIKISSEHTKYRWEKLNKTKVKKLFHKTLQDLILTYYKWNK